MTVLEWIRQSRALARLHMTLIDPDKSAVRHPAPTWHAVFMRHRVHPGA
jgi:hypothetical protein